jgi:aspartate kinase
MALLAIAIQSRGEAAVSLTGSQSGIITSDRHFDARIIEVRPHRIEDELYHGKIVIVAGYQGMSYRREITTLGRGGSDTTAVALAAALRAERCEIYSDVDGVYSADPRSVPDARHLPELDFGTMQEMAESGAKVLCSRAVEWAKQQNIAILARKTEDFALRETGRQTRVDQHESRDAHAVVVDRNVALLRCTVAQAPALLASCHELELTLRDSVYANDTFSLLLPLSGVPSPEATLAALALRHPGVEITRGVGTISRVGVGSGGDAATMAAFLASLGASPLLLVASPLRVTALLREAELGAAELAAHAGLPRAS